MRKNIKVLLCDDDEGIIEVFKVILEENDYQVRTLLDGKEIKKVIQEYQPNLIFLDVWMPGMDGQALTKLLKKNPETKKIPIILVSALSEIDVIKATSGADDYLPKPFDITDLLAKVEKYTLK